MNLIRRKSKSSRENTDPNVQINHPTSPLITKKPSTQNVNPQKISPRTDDTHQRSEIPSDSSVKVVARIRPVSGQEKEGGRIVKKLTSNSLSVGDRIFTFDSVVDSNSTQEDIFQLVGVPLVKNSLAGFNTSILSYGQTGSGKTYTMWGPPSAMVDGYSSSSSCLGIVPRIFNMLFSKIQEEQANSEDKQINYQCRCSFLEIYKEQITDLLDPTQRNLQIRDDAKNGFYVENLSEEYVTSFEDVTQILIKGLANRKVGATSINSKSSRSHIVFTCVIESWCKGISSGSCSSSKVSRISLIDLAGSERNKIDDTGRESKKERRNVKHSLSQLGYDFATIMLLKYLVNILAEVAQSGKAQNLPYKNSCLTHLLQESLGGNAKLTVICAISPDDRCRGETLSTLRFGQRAKLILNKAVINEITEDDVDDLSDQIRQLKEELIRVKLNENRPAGRNGGYFKGTSARESLNQLRLSLNRSLILPHINSDDWVEEINIDEEDVRELCVQLDNVHASAEKNLNEMPENELNMQFSSFEESSDMNMSNEDFEETIEEGLHLRKSEKEPPSINGSQSIDTIKEMREESIQDSLSVRSSLSFLSCRQSLALEEPAMSDSPRIDNNQRKNYSVKRSDHMRSSLQSSNAVSNPTESLAASLHRGLQIIDHHQRNPASKQMSVSFSFENLTLKQSQAMKKIDSGMQTLQEEGLSIESATFVCASCKQKDINSSNEVQDSLNMWNASVDEGKQQRLANQIPKDDESALADAIRKKMELEDICAKQAAQITQLNDLIKQYETKVGVIPLPTNELKSEESMLLTDESKALKLVGNIQQKERQEEEHEQKTSFDIREREELLKEIESLRNQLQSFIDASSNESSGLLQSAQMRSSTAVDESGKELEKERQKWTEMESGWISLTEELRLDLESKRCLAEKTENELRQEKKCAEELDDALHRAILGHARIVEHYAELQEKHGALVEKHRRIMEGIAEVKKAAAKAGTKGAGSRFTQSLAAELSALRFERERERNQLKKENKSLKIQLRDTAEAVHAAGELLVRLREAEEAIAATEEKFVKAQQETEKVKKQMEKLKRKHAMQIVTMKQYLAESRLPESALRPVFEQDDYNRAADVRIEDDQDWRAAFGPLCQDRYDTSTSFNSNVKSHVDLYRDK
ncbi:kinesin-like protein KIN-12F [Cinnamomum micranthum f. kanehirae]|uniref:Kinesin-like protein KIN-12F n=1 Tax=Cinnamomum micranthum f. kanehirae TaxID=337451 RepID=A0A3S3M3A2_9MAGN|nr:kinesin-like protein KIN-12F [Cinnamomum micranthum f. kanehirae]